MTWSVTSCSSYVRQVALIAVRALHTPSDLLVTVASSGMHKGSARCSLTMRRLNRFGALWAYSRDSRTYVAIMVEPL